MKSHNVQILLSRNHNRVQSYCILYFIIIIIIKEIFLVQKNPKILILFWQTELDLWDCFGREIPYFRRISYY